MCYIIKPIFPESKQEIKIAEAEFFEITDALQIAWDIVLVQELFSYVVRN